MSRQKNKYIFFDELPDWLALRHKYDNVYELLRISTYDKHAYTNDKPLQYVRSDELPHKCPHKRWQQGVFYHRMGQLNKGYVYDTKYTFNSEYFGDNVLQATRFMFLKTQKPLVK